MTTTYAEIRPTTSHPTTAHRHVLELEAAPTRGARDRSLPSAATATADVPGRPSDSITAHRYATPCVREVASARCQTSASDEAPRSGELETLLLRAAARDEAAWTTLVQRFSPRIRAVARAERLSAHDVEDVVQTTWMELLKYIDRVREPDKVGGWLYRTAKRESTRTAIAITARCENPIDVMPEPSEPFEGDARIAAAERRAALADALQALPERERALMRMLLTDREPSYAEIASSLEMPIGSIGPTRSRGLDRLRGNRHLVSVIDETAASPALARMPEQSAAA